MRQTAERISTIHLDYDQIMLIESTPHARLRVLHGGVWLTEPGMPRDVLLGSGDEVALHAHREALLQALAPTYLQRIEPTDRWRSSSLAGLERAWHAARNWVARVRERYQLGPRPAPCAGVDC